jgi:predicted permease
MDSLFALEDIVAIGRRGVTLRQGDESSLKVIHYVSGNYFDALGIPIFLGRGLRPSDDTPQTMSPVVVINYQLWIDQLGKRSDVINRTIRLNDAQFTIVGVTAPGFLGLSRLQRTDVWVTVGQSSLVVPGLEREVSSAYDRWFEVIGHVKPARRTALETELNTVLGNWRGDNADQYGNANLIARDYLAEDRQNRSQGAIFLSLVVLVLLIACANVANLTLARGESKRRELAVRTALGATAGQLLFEALREALLLSIVAALAGVLIASWLIGLFPALVPQGIAQVVIDAQVDARLFAFVALISMLTFVLVGILPAWLNRRSDVYTAIKEESANTTIGRRRFFARDSLIVAEVGLSVMVLIAAGMLARTFRYSRNLNPGFDTHKNVSTFYIVPGLSGYNTDATYRFFETARQNVASIPGVRRTSFAIRLPAQSNESGWAADFTIPGKQPPAGELFFHIKYTMVGPQYFETMGTRIIQGRGIDDTDLPNSTGVAVINETMARNLWPQESAIGQSILVGRENPKPRTIIGIAEDNRIASLYEDQQMYVYVPYSQDRQLFGLFLVETEPNAPSITSVVRSRIRQIDSRLRILDTNSVAEHMHLVLFDERRDAIVAACLAGLSLFLSVVGVYSVVSLVTKRRIREIGIRFALGATRPEMVRLVVLRTWTVTVFGIVIGACGGGVIGRLLQSRLHGVASFDSLSIAIAGLMLFACATVASVLPSWRATTVDPTQALRHE